MSQPVPDFEPFVLKDDGTFPNNPLPVLLYRHGIPIHGPDPAVAFEERYRKNGWEGIWRNGVFDFHHYHATAHEVLGCARGSVTVELGGPRGREVTLEAGDVVVLPAGTAHMNVGHEGGYQIVGAYPPDQAPDMCYGKPGERADANRAIAEVELPGSDPVYGDDGPLRLQWGTS